jgi:hypothetical protein
MEETGETIQSVNEEQIKSRLEDKQGVFIPALHDLSLVKSDAGAGLVMSVLEYMFSKQPNGFYKFYEPHPDHPEYKKGNSWREEFHTNINDFKLNFDQIGIRYNSYQEFVEATNKFGDSNKKYYCSYYDPNLKQAYYIRNHSLVNEAIKSVLGEVTVGMMWNESIEEQNRTRKKVNKEIERRKQSGEALTMDILWRY